MNWYILAALPLILGGTTAFAGMCDRPVCKPGFYMDTSNDRNPCLACTGNTSSDGCGRSCGACGAGTRANAAHSMCVAIPPCPASIPSSHIPTTVWSAASNATGYNASGSYVATVTPPVNTILSSATLSQIMSEMGAAFRRANFSVAGGLNHSAEWPPAVIQCQYSANFPRGGRTEKATVAINCTGTCAGL